MREERSATWHKGIWASLSEGRPPLADEIDTVAAKIWRDAYRRDAPIPWEEVEVGSAPHRKSLAAALAALGAPPARS